MVSYLCIYQQASHFPWIIFSHFRLGPEVVQIGTNRKNWKTRGFFFQIRFQYISAARLKKNPGLNLPLLGSIWPTLAQNMTSLQSPRTRQFQRDRGCQIWHTNWVRLVPVGTNMGLFKISFSRFQAQRKVSDLSHLGANPTQFGWQICHP